MVLRKKKEGTGYFIGCKGYPTCNSALWLPDGITNATVTSANCDKCKSCALIRFTFKKQSIPLGYPTDVQINVILSYFEVYSLRRLR
jgi:ssDNA-binding Zn-finger/Zn-ribbon topoisomerase 1